MTHELTFAGILPRSPHFQKENSIYFDLLKIAYFSMLILWAVFWSDRQAVWQYWPRASSDDLIRLLQLAFNARSLECSFLYLPNIITSENGADKHLGFDRGSVNVNRNFFTMWPNELKIQLPDSFSNAFWLFDCSSDIILTLQYSVSIFNWAPFHT